MKMMKKSGIALMLGALMIASVPTTSHCFTINRQRTIAAAGTLLILSLALLHFQKYLPTSVTDNAYFKSIIGTPEKKGTTEVEGISNNSINFRHTPSVPSTGLAGKVDEVLSGAFDKLDKNYKGILAVGAILAVLLKAFGPDAAHA